MRRNYLSIYSLADIDRWVLLRIKPFYQVNNLPLWHGDASCFPVIGVSLNMHENSTSFSTYNGVHIETNGDGILI